MHTGQVFGALTSMKVSLQVFNFGKNWIPCRECRYCSRLNLDSLLVSALGFTVSSGSLPFTNLSYISTFLIFTHHDDNFRDLLVSTKPTSSLPENRCSSVISES